MPRTRHPISKPPVNVYAVHVHCVNPTSNYGIKVNALSATDAADVAYDRLTTTYGADITPPCNHVEYESDCTIGVQAILRSKDGQSTYYVIKIEG